ncbi:fibronectin type III domain-containing protein [Thermincola potens]|uniref:Fibronectin type III domain protein n=1 Tax=Thermincola potens (strain JR) TaxID=635013 RepID=D5XD20_THEPJ|nr:fibronectin type III domain-containing protein [Thermincola potens]ADG83696.1 Fibronectin type III domain protein [Thermincola potens JR]
MPGACQTGNKSITGIKLVVAGIVLLALGVLWQITPARSQQGAYFSDQFNMNAYDWTPARGTWAVVNGEYTETVDPASEEAWSVAGSISWFDYIVEARVYSTDSNGTVSLAGRWVDEKSYYALEYGDSGTPESARLILYKRVNGKRVNLAQWNRSGDARVPYIGEGAAFVPGNPFPVVLKLKFSGASIEVYVNSTLIGSVSDTSLYYGKIAVGEYNRKAFFDDIYVWDITPPKIRSIEIPEEFRVGNAVTVRFVSNEYASHRLEYGTTPSYGHSKIMTARRLEHSVDISGLTPNTTYHYRITVTDAGGNSFTTDDMTFTTGAVPDVVAPAVYDVAYTDVTSDSAVISWQTDEMSNSIIEYGTSPGSYKWTLSYDEKTTGHVVRLKRLSGNTIYYFRVSSRDTAGNLGVSAEGTFSTLKDLKPRINRVDTGSSPSVYLTVYWERIPVAVRYKVYVSTSNNWNESPDAVVSETGNTSYWYTKTGLVNDTNYYIKVLAEDAQGGSAYTVARAFPPDQNPHGYYWENPQLCQCCHATHTASGPRLITHVNADRLCISCHDGSQSKYNVLRGKYKGPDSNLYESIAGPYGSLEGVTVPENEQLTSRHDLDIFIYTATGNNIEDQDTAESHLSCASCHDPHGSENYRNLRANMRVSADPDAPLIRTEAYAVTQAAYEQTVYVSGAVEFCGACHSDFNQGAGASREARSTTDQPGLQLSLSSLHKYMHPVNIDAQYVTDSGHRVPVPDYLPLENGKIICQTCHFSHGTLNTGEHVRRDGYSSTVLKRFDEAVGCEDCHDKTNFPDE